jgi:hypothetical protein
LTRFVLCTNLTTGLQDQAFIAILRSRWPNVGWWHWLAEMWLMVDLSDTVKSSELRDAALEAFPGVHNIVLEFGPNGDTWTGFGPTGPARDMFEWMRNTWTRHPDAGKTSDFSALLGFMADQKKKT